MALGGSDRDTSSGNMSSTETFREGASAWTSASSMTVARAHHNTVLLPDGSMVSVGGGYGVVGGDQWVSGSSHKSVDLWDPATRAWTKGPSQVENRGYHSTAVLLPDGRVLSAGDDVNGGIDRDTAEIYSPPYLFRGDRPAISSAPSSIGWGERFAVGTPSVGVTRAVLVAPSAVTHSVDMNQRVVSLALAPGAAGVELTAPANGRIAPPGYYMLFLLNDRGVPSVARWVRLGASSAPAPGDTAPPTAPTALSATAASPARVDLTWTASSDDVGVTGYEVVREGATVATVTGTSWADTSVAPSTSYEYRVRARDAAGNLSGLSSPATVTTSAGGGPATLTFAAAADVSVEEKDAGGNYGTSTVLRVDAGGDPDAQTYLRFEVGGLPGPVRGAKLRLFTSNGTANGPPAYSTSSSWTETGLTWLARPAATSAGRDDKGAIGLGVWVEWDVTPFVTGDGPVSLMLAGTSSDGVDFYSRETANGPQLVVSTG
jgi:chitodextrinase